MTKNKYIYIYKKHKPSPITLSPTGINLFFKHLNKFSPLRTQGQHCFSHFIDYYCFPIKETNTNTHTVNYTLYTFTIYLLTSKSYFFLIQIEVN